MGKQSDLLQGTLDMLVLKTLALGPMHGWGISQRIQQVSEDVLVINQGSLYPALYRLEQQGLIKSEWGSSENNRQAKYYELTRTGKSNLPTRRITGSGCRRRSIAFSRQPNTIPINIAGGADAR
jgi:transcriptional regulator